MSNPLPSDPVLPTVTAEIWGWVREFEGIVRDHGQTAGAVNDARESLVRRLSEKLQEGARDTERLDWLGSQLNCVVTKRDADGVYRDTYLHGSDMTIREAVDEQLAASRGTLSVKGDVPAAPSTTETRNRD